MSLLATWLSALDAAHAAPPVVPKPLPEPVVSQAPGIHPLGRGRHLLWGIRLYDATLWIVGEEFAPAEPHALDIEASKSVAADTMLSSAMGEMGKLKLGDAAQLATWRKEMKRLMPSVRAGDQIVIFCPPDGKTLLYYNGHSRGEADDVTLCPAIMNVWLHPQSTSKEMRKSLLGQ